MKEYPSISTKIISGTYYYLFDKLDGSLVRAEWNPKRGFYKFGKRHGLIDGSNPHLEKAPALIQAKYGSDLGRIFSQHRWHRATAYFELWGPRSFAGDHHPNDSLDVTLFDIAVDTKGLLTPNIFTELFDELDIAKVLYYGQIGRDIEEQVRSGKLGGMSFEGVVAKGQYASPGLPSMFKIKNRAWLQKLRHHCKDNETLFQKLA
jgi:hypothetical protein